MSQQQQLTTAILDPVPARRVDDVPVAEEMSDSFLAYALSVITSRAIPDVRDGLKPVQRRVLWSMLQMGVRPGTPYRKSARIVGDTMGRYHPHGDAAIYDTLVRMGQDFGRMVPLVDPQGNFGSPDDPPAAARYTECRLSAAAMDMVGELDEDTVDFRPTYDGEDTEPAVLPAALPNLLVNGTTGIAVGMATNMLPHNLAEIGEAIELVMSKQPPAPAGGPVAGVADGAAAGTASGALVGTEAAAGATSGGGSSGAVSGASGGGAGGAVSASAVHPTLNLSAAAVDASSGRPAAGAAQDPAAGSTVGEAGGPPASQAQAPSQRRASQRKPRPTTDELMAKVPGPDFPGGGIVLADDGLRQAYETGRGSVRVRARAGVEQVTRRRRAIVVTELPHLVGPERVVSKISELANAGRLAGVSGATDLTDLEGLRLQIDLKPDADPGAVMSDLFRLTPLEETFSVNNVVLVGGVPTTVGLRELCEHYISHRLEVIVRRTRHRLRRAEERLHIVEGLLVALDNIDQVVALIRGSRDSAAARAGLMARFDLSETQATHILDMALRRLTALERRKLTDEAAALRSRIEDCRAILASDRKRRNIVRRELRRIVNDHGRPRRSLIRDAGAADAEFAEFAGAGEARGAVRSTSRSTSATATPTPTPTVATVATAAATSATDADRTGAGEARFAAGRDGIGSVGAVTGRDAPCVLTVSTTGNIGRMPAVGARRAKPGRHDLIAARVATSTASPVAAVTAEGRAFTVLGGAVAEAANRVRGQDAAAMLGLNPRERVLALVSDSDDGLVLVTARGTVKRLAASAVLGAAPGSPVIALAPGDRLIAAFSAVDDCDIVIAADDGRALRLACSSVSVKSPQSAGVAGIKLREGAEAVGAGAVVGDAVLVQATPSGALKSTYCSEFPTQGRGGQGVLVAKLALGDTVAMAVVGDWQGMLALMGRDDDPRRIDPHPVPVREQPTPRYRPPTSGERRIHALAPGRW